MKTIIRQRQIVAYVALFLQSTVMRMDYYTLAFSFVEFRTNSARRTFLRPLRHQCEESPYRCHSSSQSKWQGTTCLFSTKGEGKDGQQQQQQPDPKNNGDDQDDDFSAWITANLKQWPMLPSTTSDPSPAPPPLQLTEQPFKDSPTDGRIVVGERLKWNATAAANAMDETSFLRSPLSRVFNIETLLQLTVNSASKSSSMAAAAATAVISTMNWTALEELASLDKWVGGLMQTTGKSAEGLLKQATSAVSPEMVQALIRKSSEMVSNVTSSTSTNSNNNNINLNLLPEAADRARETTAYAASLLRTADGIFRKGYVAGDPVAAKAKRSKQSFLQDIPVVAGSRALFDAFESVTELNMLTNTIVKAAEMGALAGAIYEDTVPRTRALGQTIVARGTTEDVAWMVTDAIANRTSFQTTPAKTTRGGRNNNNRASGDNNNNDDGPSFVVRTITIRGFDASDESVDRELLVNRICTAAPVPINSKSGVLVHSGLLEIARAVYRDVKQYIDWTAPSDKIVFNGHSVGGSISLLLLFLMIKDYGVDFVKETVVRVYTFGSPPVAVMKRGSGNIDIMDAMELPTSLVQGFVQPWDPLVRLFTTIDALYPLVGDLGPDNITPFADGPPRALRPILKSILESWVGWPRFRDNFKGTANQTYVSVGVQHILLPEPTRYLADRFLAVNIPVPPVETVLRISSKELYPALASAFPLDVFQVSFVPQAVRSFVHHFYPAYSFPLVDYVKELQRQSVGLPERPTEFALSEEEAMVVVAANNNGGGTTTTAPDGGIDWRKAKQWLIRSEPKP